ncbi:MAG: hypothetical protein NVS2B7_31520 [Herpetosiphon sp.]
MPTEGIAHVPTTLCRSLSHVDRVTGVHRVPFLLPLLIRTNNPARPIVGFHASIGGG